MIEAYLKSSHQNIYKKILLKALIVLMICALYSLSYCMSQVIESPLTDSPETKPVGVCVFDIDFTLACPGSEAAVKVCKDAGFALAINTARIKKLASVVLYDNTLIRKGFSQEFVDRARKQVNLEGPFQYKEERASGQPAEQLQQNKSYGMRKIANYYKFKTDDVESRKIVIFDDKFDNVNQMQPAWYEGYNKELCKYTDSGECHFNPLVANTDVEFPRNWKIYRAKWIGNYCSRWYSSSEAAKDAKEMISNVLNNRERIY